jgi:hypothetical protein
MKKCWKLTPRSRPSFAELEIMLANEHKLEETFTINISKRLKAKPKPRYDNI